MLLERGARSCRREKRRCGIGMLWNDKVGDAHSGLRKVTFRLLRNKLRIIASMFHNEAIIILRYRPIIIIELN
jgi:hypothetical protein